MERLDQQIANKSDDSSSIDHVCTAVLLKENTTTETEKEDSDTISRNKKMRKTNYRLHDLFKNIIPVEYMGIRIDQYDGNTITLSAPLSSNSNDKGTAFAGSIYSTLVLSGWSLITLSLQDYYNDNEQQHQNTNDNDNGPIEFVVVVASSSTKYLKPVSSDMFQSVACIRQQLSQQHQQEVEKEEDNEVIAVKEINNNKNNNNTIQSMHQSILNKGKGKIEVECVVYSENVPCATFTAWYVASIKKETTKELLDVKSLPKSHM